MMNKEEAKARLETRIREAHQTYEKRLAQIEAAEKSGPPKNVIERYLTAVAMRESGKTFKEIGRSLNVTGGRAGVMVSTAYHRGYASRSAEDNAKYEEQNRERMEKRKQFLKTYEPIFDSVVLDKK